MSQSRNKVCSNFLFFHYKRQQSLRVRQSSRIILLHCVKNKVCYFPFLSLFGSLFSQHIKLLSFLTRLSRPFVGQFPRLPYFILEGMGSKIIGLSGKPCKNLRVCFDIWHNGTQTHYFLLNEEISRKGRKIKISQGIQCGERSGK